MNSTSEDNCNHNFWLWQGKTTRQENPTFKPWLLAGFIVDFSAVMAARGHDVRKALNESAADRESQRPSQAV
jgi:hypothetical protein